MRGYKEEDNASGGYRKTGLHFFIQSSNYMSLTVLALVLKQVHGLEVSGSILLLICWAEGVSSIAALFVARQNYIRNSAMTIMFLSIIALLGLISIAHFSGYQHSPIFDISLVPILIVPSVFLALTCAKRVIIDQRVSRSLYMYLYCARYTLLVTVWIVVSKIDSSIIRCFICYFSILLAIAVLGILFAKQKPPRSSFNTLPGGDHLRRVVAASMKGADVIALPFLFELSEISIYLVARLLGLTIAPISQILAMRGAEVLAKEYISGSSRKFVGKAARLNLSIFLIGGGAALVPVAIGAIISPMLQASQDQFLFLLFWCVVGQSYVCIFGFSSEILEITGRTVETDLAKFGLLVGFSGICIFMDDLNIQDFVILFVAMQYIATAISAVIVAVRFGIWPGPTALFFGQIRLFQRTTNSA